MLPLRRYERISTENRRFPLQRDQSDPKLQEEGIALTNNSSAHKTRLNHIACGIKISTELSSVLSDGQADGRTDSFLVASPRWHSMQSGKNGRHSPDYNMSAK